MARKMTQTITILAALMLVLALSAVPAFASSDGSNGKGDEKKAEQAQDAQDDSKGNSKKDDSNETNTSGTSQTSDHDGDADSDAGTAMEDSHADEPDATPSDNQHPSGKDRSGESGGSGNQGKSESNPDDSKGPMRYEGGLGDDKPGGPGGTDRDDQDGNNGCGNDDDFDDDNNGWCGKKPENTKPVKTCPAGSDNAGDVMTDIKDCNEDEDEVEAEVITGPCDADGNMANGVQACDNTVQPSKPKIENEVLADVITNPAQPEVDSPEVAAERASMLPAAVLPFTGGTVLPLLAVALGLIATGLMIAKANGKEH